MSEIKELIKEFAKLRGCKQTGEDCAWKTCIAFHDCEKFAEFILDREAKLKEEIKTLEYKVQEMTPLMNKAVELQSKIEKAKQFAQVILGLTDDEYVAGKCRQILSE